MEILSAERMKKKIAEENRRMTSVESDGYIRDLKEMIAQAMDFGGNRPSTSWSLPVVFNTKYFHYTNEGDMFSMVRSMVSFLQNKGYEASVTPTHSSKIVTLKWGLKE